MTLHIKKIMDGMLICTVLESSLDNRLSDYFYNHMKTLICKGFTNILLDLTNVERMDAVVAEHLYELHKLMTVSGGSLQIFGIDEEIEKVIKNSQYGHKLNLQQNEILEPDLADILLYHGNISMAS